MVKEYINYNKDNREFIAEKIFINKSPRSKVVLSKVKEIKNVMNNKQLKSNNVINYSMIEKIEGSYYLLNESKEYYKPLIDKIKDNEVNLKMAVKWIKQLIEIWLKAEGNKFNSEIKLNFLRINKNNNLKIVDPFINQLIDQYKYKNISNEFDEMYRPPEVINGKDWDEKSRIYNFGVIAYYLLTNKFPFQGENKQKMYNKKMTGSVLAPHHENPNISSELGNIIFKMLQSKKKNRQNSLKEVLDEINAIIKGDQIKAEKNEYKENEKKGLAKQKKKKMKENVIFFFRHHWGKTALVLLLIGMLTIAFTLGGNPPTITKETTPDQVVNYFYEAFNKKDPILIDETVTVNLKKLSTMISEGHVMETMRNAYGEPADENVKSEVFGLKDININKSSTDDYYIYNIKYIFYYNTQEETKEIKMRDTLTVKMIEDKWQITEIKGDIVSFIEGRFEG